MTSRRFLLIGFLGLSLSFQAFAKDCENELQSEPLTAVNEAAKAWKLLEDFWTAELKKVGRRLPPAKLVLFDDKLSTACGEMDDGFGPVYCLLDHTVYLPVSFWTFVNEALNRDSAAARLMVLAHEYGHHVMTQIGFQWKVHALMARTGNVNETLKIMEFGENLADALAGYFAGHMNRKNRLTSEDHEDLLVFFEGIGDDRMHDFFKIEKHEGCQNYHGCSQDRLAAFIEGFRAENLHGLFQNRYEWLLRHVAVTPESKRKIYKLMFRPRLWGWPIAGPGI